jgi:hypothetical protein
MLPYFVLGGMAGMRTCELVRSNPGDPVLNWEDILWTKNLITLSLVTAPHRLPQLSGETQ